jgi:hypothetical protein
MGMFDTFYPNKKTKCSSCLTKSNDGIQTKEFENTLREYHIGDMIDSSTYMNEVIIEDTYYCRICHAETKFYIGIKNNIFVSIKKNKKKVGMDLKNFSYANFYSTMYQEKEKYKDKYYGLKSSISDAIYYFDDKNNNTLGKKFSHIRISDMLADDIVGTIENIIANESVKTNTDN